MYVRTPRVVYKYICIMHALVAEVCVLKGLKYHNFLAFTRPAHYNMYHKNSFCARVIYGHCGLDVRTYCARLYRRSSFTSFSLFIDGNPIKIDFDEFRRNRVRTFAVHYHGFVTNYWPLSILLIILVGGRRPVLVSMTWRTDGAENRGRNSSTTRIVASTATIRS